MLSLHHVNNNPSFFSLTLKVPPPIIEPPLVGRVAPALALEALIAPK